VTIGSTIKLGAKLGVLSLTTLIYRKFVTYLTLSITPGRRISSSKPFSLMKLTKLETFH
jgi:hypothetical protein